MYEEIERILSSDSLDEQSKARLKSIVKALNEGIKIQESSANIMNFLIQDLLDYAQINAGKFRKNIEKFNIMDAIEEVMCIQRQNAKDKKI